jgi:hypothetical protein
MLAWKGAERQRPTAELKRPGEIKSSLSSSMFKVLAPRRSCADRAARVQPPTRRPSKSAAGAGCPVSTKWFVLGDMAAAVGRGISPEGNHRAVCS